MKKRLLALTLAVILIFSIILAVPAFANQVTALSNGFTNVPFSNGYYGYCIDRDLSGAYTNDVFYASDTSIAKSNVDNSDISQFLKNLFVLNFELLFVSDGNGGYVLDSVKKDSTVPSAVYHFSEGQYVWGESKTVTNTAKAYTGPAIPDEGYTISLDNGDFVTFYFMCLEPEKTDQQTFFAYKIEVSQEAPTTEESTTAPEETTTEESTTAPVETTTESTTAAPVETTTESTTATPVETTTESTTATPVETTTESTTAAPVETTTESTTAAPVETTTESTTVETTTDPESNGGSSTGGGPSGGGGPNAETTTTAGGTNGGSGNDNTSTTVQSGAGSDSDTDSNPTKNPNTNKTAHIRLLLVVMVISGFGIVLFSNRKKLYNFN